MLVNYFSNYHSAALIQKMNLTFNVKYKLISVAHWLNLNRSVHTYMNIPLAAQYYSSLSLWICSSVDEDCNEQTLTLPDAVSHNGSFL